MATRKEEKERLRQARLEAEQREMAEARRRLIFGYVAAGVLTAAVVAGIVAVILSGGGGPSGNAHIASGPGTTTSGLEPDDRVGNASTPGPLASASTLPQAAKAANCVLRNPPDEGNTHLSPDQPTPNYKSNPPTSGDHDPFPLANGAYRAPITDFRHAVHSLEHGRVEVQYKSSLPENEQLKIKGVIDESFIDMILFQNDEMPYEVAATAWDHLLGCPKYNPKVLDAIRAFRDTYRDQGPEPPTNQPR